MKTNVSKRISLNPRGIERIIRTTQMPTGEDFLGRYICYTFSCSCGRHAHVFHILPETVTVTGHGPGGAGTIKSNVPHKDALSLLVRDTDTTVLFELRILGLFELVDVIRHEKTRVEHQQAHEDLVNK